LGVNDDRPNEKASAVPDFVRRLAEQGCVRVSPHSIIVELDQNTEQAIRDLDRATRAEMPGTAPTLDPPAAFWGLGLLENACRFLAFREIEAKEISETLSKPISQPMSPSVVYSVDLFLRFLPDVLRLARGLGQDDPLVDRLLAIARQWPLSSVGISGVAVDDPHVQIILGDASLRQLYVDRIMERKDTSRLTAQNVAEAVRISIGAYPMLAPEIIKAIERK
jgi:hypothetical protein